MFAVSNDLRDPGCGGMSAGGAASEGLEADGACSEGIVGCDGVDGWSEVLTGRERELEWRSRSASPRQKTAVWLGYSTQRADRRPTGGGISGSRRSGSRPGPRRAPDAAG
jgi:hypothetical protein